MNREPVIANKTKYLVVVMDWSFYYNNLFFLQVQASNENKIEEISDAEAAEFEKKQYVLPFNNLIAI